MNILSKEFVLNLRLVAPQFLKEKKAMACKIIIYKLLFIKK